MEAAHKDARHAEWLLERQFPKEFAPISARDIPAPIAQLAAPNVSVVHMYDDQSIEMRRLQDEYARAARDGQPFSAPESKTPPQPLPVITPVIGTDTAAPTATDTNITAKRWKTHALSGRGGSQIPTTDR
jgi:hypothetical protein